MTPHEAEQIRRLAAGVRSDLAMVDGLRAKATTPEEGWALSDVRNDLVDAAERLEAIAGRTLGNPHPSRSSQ